MDACVWVCVGVRVCVHIHKYTYVSLKNTGIQGVLVLLNEAQECLGKVQIVTGQVTSVTLTQETTTQSWEARHSTGGQLTGEPQQLCIIMMQPTTKRQVECMAVLAHGTAPREHQRRPSFDWNEAVGVERNSS